MYYSFETIIKYCGIYSWFNKFLFSDKKKMLHLNKIVTATWNTKISIKYYISYDSFTEKIHIPTPFGCKNIVNYFKYLERFYNSFLYS